MNLEPTSVLYYVITFSDTNRTAFLFTGCRLSVCCLSRQVACAMCHAPHSSEMQSLRLAFSLTPGIVWVVLTRLLFSINQSFDTLSSFLYQLKPLWRFLLMLTSLQNNHLAFCLLGLLWMSGTISSCDPARRVSATGLKTVVWQWWYGVPPVFLLLWDSSHAEIVSYVYTIL